MYTEYEIPYAETVYTYDCKLQSIEFLICGWGVRAVLRFTELHF